MPITRGQHPKNEELQAELDKRFSALMRPALERGLLLEAYAALRFIADISAEELPNVPVGTGAEVALRHIKRKTDEFFRNWPSYKDVMGRKS